MLRICVCRTITYVAQRTVCSLNSPFGMAGEPVAEDGDSVDGTTAVEMDLQLICSGSIIYLGFCSTVCQIWKIWKKDAQYEGEIYKSYISYIDRSVVCIYPLLRCHVVERPCGGNKKTSQNLASTYYILCESQAEEGEGETCGENQRGRK